MRKIILLLFLFAYFWATAQNKTMDFEKTLQPLNEKIENLQADNSKLHNDINALATEVKTYKQLVDSISIKAEINTKDLGSKITSVDESLGKNSLYGIIALLLAIIVSTLLYWLLRKKQRTDKFDFTNQLSKTKSTIEESLVKEFSKQTVLMDEQVHLLEQQKITVQATPNTEPDHSLALKVADQVTLIERSINLMDDNVKGLQRIRNSITTLKDNLAANGYDLPTLLGKPFNQGMKAIVSSSVPDENLKKDEEMITRIIKPQVNYKDKMIQAAQIEVSVGY
jgi:phage shock protein A